MLSNYNQKVRINFLLKTNLNDMLEERFLKGKITGGEDPFSRVLGIVLIGYPHLIKILEAPFKLSVLITGKEYDCNFHAGFLGVTQDPVTYVVKPLIGWYIDMGPEYDGN